MCETHDLTADILCTQHDVCCSSSTLQHFLNVSGPGYSAFNLGEEIHCITPILLYKSSYLET